MLRIHSSFHKCLTAYFIRVMSILYNRPERFRRPGYRHFEGLEGMFYNQVGNYKFVSVNGFAIDTSRLDEDFRISRFVRDPRDLVVSGYFYHLKGAEHWFTSKDPNERYWYPINGAVPEGIGRGMSYSDYLQSLDKEEGLIAEIQFRKYHLDSIRNWEKDERIRIFRYEDIIGNEKKIFHELLSFHKLSRYKIRYGSWVARQLSLTGIKPHSKHVRNPEPGQWKEHFTPKVEEYFMEHFGDTLEILDYD